MTDLEAIVVVAVEEHLGIACKVFGNEEGLEGIVEVVFVAVHHQRCGPDGHLEILLGVLGIAVVFARVVLLPRSFVKHETGDETCGHVTVHVVGAVVGAHILKYVVAHIIDLVHYELAAVTVLVLGGQVVAADGGLEIRDVPEHSHQVGILIDLEEVCHGKPMFVGLVAEVGPVFIEAVDEYVRLADAGESPRRTVILAEAGTGLRG